MLISIVIPMYNEAKRIEKTLGSIKNTVSNWQERVELILIDDGSIDTTYQVAQTFIKNNNLPAQLLSLGHNLGKGAAVKRGVFEASGDVIVIFDADNSTNIETFQNVKNRLKDSDIIIGSRYLAGSDIVTKQSFKRRIISRAGNVVIHLLLGLPYKDTQCGFKILKSDVAKKIMKKLTINRWGFDIEMLVIARYMNAKIAEVPVRWSDANDSKLRAAQALFQTLSEVIKIYQNRRSGLYNLN